MRERPENFNAADDESEVTLVAPRFDAEEARRAHPVVPLAQAREPLVSEGPRAGRGLRRPWTPALLGVAVLAVAALGGAVATKVFSGTQPDPVAAHATAEVAPAQPAEGAAQLGTPPGAEAGRGESRSERQTPRPTRDREAGERAAVFPAESPREDDEEFEDQDEGRRGKGKERRRSRAEDEVEQEARKVLKRAKDKAPRLVDVLVSP